MFAKGYTNIRAMIEPNMGFFTNDNGYSLQIPDAIKTNRGRSRLIGAR